VPLLEGTWTVAGTGGGGGELATSLVRIEQGKLWGIIRVWTSPTAAARPYGQCGRTDVLYTMVVANVPHGDQDCWMINHALMAQSRTEQTQPHQRQSYEFLDARGISIGGGLTMITAIHRVAAPTGAVTVWYQVNPEFFGFAPSSASSWSGSEWHRDRIAADPKRVAFIESYKALHARYQEHVKAGFVRQLDAFTPQPLAVAAARLNQFAARAQE
jgi:hypothetical protein